MLVAAPVSLVEEDEARRVHVPLPGPPPPPLARDVGPVLLGGPDGLFF
jgi:hypothetical protein